MLPLKGPCRHCGHRPVSRDDYECPTCRGVDPNPTPLWEKLAILAAMLAVVALGLRALTGTGPLTAF